MPEEKTLERAREDAREGKAPSTQAGEFVREEIEHIRKGKHGARSPKQAIAIGLSKARRAGVKLPPPRKGKTSSATSARAERDYRRGQTRPNKKVSPSKSRAREQVLKREGREAASSEALSRQARSAARSRGRTNRQQAAKKAVHTKGRSGVRSAARKAAHTRSQHQ
jgi:Family of unknown function (DUF6496)